jgi:hypothetical protein
MIASLFFTLFGCISVRFYIWSRIVRVIVIEACLTISHSLSYLELLSEWIAINRLYIYLSWIVFTIGFGRVSILFVRIRHRIGRDVSIGRHIHTCVCSYMYDQAYLHVEMSLAYSCSPIGPAITIRLGAIKPFLRRRYWTVIVVLLRIVPIWTEKR